MNDEKITELMFKFTSELSALNANMKSVLDKLTNHEARLSKLEDNKSSLKDTTINWLVKGLIASIAVIGSLTGAGTLLKAIFGI